MFLCLFCVCVSSCDCSGMSVVVTLVRRHGRCSKSSNAPRSTLIGWTPIMTSSWIGLTGTATPPTSVALRFHSL